MTAFRWPSPREERRDATKERAPWPSKDTELISKARDASHPLPTIRGKSWITSIAGLYAEINTHEVACRDPRKPMFPRRNAIPAGVRKTTNRCSVRPPKNGALRGRFIAVHASPHPNHLIAFPIKRDATHRGARFFLDFRFAIGAAAPEGVSKPALHRFFQVLVI